MLVLTTGGCAHHTLQPSFVDIDGLPLRIELTDVPFYPQETHQCGPAALATVLNGSGVPVTASEISKGIYAPVREGSFQPLLISTVRHHDRLPYPVKNFRSLLREVADGNPVLVLQDLRFWGTPLWHYAVVVGYDLETRNVFLRSGRTFRKKSSFTMFDRSWKQGERWGLVVMPLDKLPATAEESTYLKAAADFEDVSHWKAAIAAYETASIRWPKSLKAAMGLGNSHFAAGDLEASEKAFRRAIQLCETCGDAFNNLSHVLAEQHRLEEALEAVRKAIVLGGPNQRIYMETFREIMRLKNNSDGK